MRERWYCQRQARRNFRSGSESVVRKNGRSFEIDEFYALDFGGDFKMHGPFYRVAEWAILDHEPHRRDHGEFRTKAKAESCVSRIAATPLDREAEAKRARPTRLKWLQGKSATAEGSLAKLRTMTKREKAPERKARLEGRIERAVEKAKALRREVRRTERMLS